MVLPNRDIGAFAIDSEWLTSNYEDIRESRRQVVAIKDKDILVDGETMEDVLRELESLGENAEFLLIEVIPPDDASFIL